MVRTAPRRFARDRPFSAATRMAPHPQRDSAAPCQISMLMCHTSILRFDIVSITPQTRTKRCRTFITSVHRARIGDAAKMC
jgi:hypothetical protein